MRTKGKDYNSLSLLSEQEDGDFPIFVTLSIRCSLHTVRDVTRTLPSTLVASPIQAKPLKHPSKEDHEREEESP